MHFCGFYLFIHSFVTNFFSFHLRCNINFFDRDFGPGQQCCYGSSGDIIVGPPGGGTADLVAPTNWKTTIAHILVDVVPFVLCCTGLFKNCNRYYNKRPSDDCSDWPRRPPPGIYRIAGNIAGL